MLSLLRPREYVASIYHIDLNRLWEMGIRGIVTDLDNTLVEWNAPAATPKLVAWTTALLDRGFQVCIVSNNDAARVSEFARPLGIPALHKARKPRRASFFEALRVLGTTPAETAMVGDQLFTDVLGGNRSGLYTILVAPIHRREFVGTRLVRVAERAVLRVVAKIEEREEHFR